MIHALCSERKQSFIDKMQQMISSFDQTAEFVSPLDVAIDFDKIKDSQEIVLWVDMSDKNFNGLKVIRESKKLWPEGKFIWMDDDESAALQAFSEGVDGFLLLPMDYQKVEWVMRNISQLTSMDR